MSSYVPPHLRGGGAQESPPSSAPSSSRGGFSRGGGYGSGSGSGRDYGGSFGGGYGRPNGRENGYDYGGSRRPSSESRTLPSVDVVWANWKPSDRVNRLQEDQILEVRNRLNVVVEVSPNTPPAPAPVESFEDMMLHPNIQKDIVYHSYTTPTPIQAQAMPIGLTGRDLLGCAETGSGKTAAFSIPMIQHCLNQLPLRNGDGPLALVLAPTRELAQQIEKEVKAFSRSSQLKTAIIVGGTHMGDQKAELRSGVEIVVATPGRFIDHLQQRNTSLSRVSYVVLDEADRMLDMGFEPQIKEIMRNLPTKHQTLLFSATMPGEIEALAQEYLDQPVRVKVGRVSSPTANVSQVLEKVNEKDKIDTLLQLLVTESSQVEPGQSQPLTIVFVERKARCDEITDALIAEGLKAVSLHGGRSQSEREGALRDFRSGKTNILVATDVASRGLDVSGVSHVVNMDLPKTLEDYVHRIGRTGRAGATGRATSFHTERDAFLVAQIRRALSEVESGNTMAFATGKAARKQEREAAAAFREGRNTASGGVAVLGSTTVRLDDKYKHILAAVSEPKAGSSGTADDAWDD